MVITVIIHMLALCNSTRYHLQSYGSKTKRTACSIFNFLDHDVYTLGCILIQVYFCAPDSRLWLWSIRCQFRGKFALCPGFSSKYFLFLLCWYWLITLFSFIFHFSLCCIWDLTHKKTAKSASSCWTRVSWLVYQFMYDGINYKQCVIWW